MSASRKRFELLSTHPVVVSDTVILGGPTKLRHQDKNRWPIWWVAKAQSVHAVPVDLLWGWLCARGLCARLEPSEYKLVMQHIQVRKTTGVKVLSVVMLDWIHDVRPLQVDLTD